MTHLGERVSALIDGQLGPAETERATSHLARCRDCRDAVETERLTKARLGCLPGPEPGADLMGRLLAMGGPSGPLPPRPGHVPGTPRPKTVQVARPVPDRPTTRSEPVRPAPGPGQAPATRRPGVRRRRVRLAGAVLGALGVVGAGVGGLVITSPTLAGGGTPRTVTGVDANLVVPQQRSTATPSPVVGVRGPRLAPPVVGESEPALYRPDR